MKNKISKNIALVLAILLFAVQIAGCAPQKKSSFVIGVVSPAPSMEPVLQGFKDGMAEKGFVEGKNVTYIYHGPLGSDAAKLEAEVQSFVDAKVDLILSLATPATVAAQKVTAGTKIPVVFTPISDPLGAGFVKSINKPGGNMTGVRNGGFTPKNLEWLKTIVPSIKKIYAPYNPKDKSAIFARGLLLETATKLGIEVVTPEIASADDIPGVLAKMPEDINAIFCISDSMVLSRVADIVAAANERKIPVTAVSRAHVEAGTLMGFGSEFNTVGKQTAGVAAQILNGADPATLPVEESEYFLYLNQKTANSLGITLPDEALKAAAGVIR
jgi:putative ABC transport system substrate-binding protein